MGNFDLLVLKKKSKSTSLPVAPHCQKSSKKYKQKCHVGDPHDDIHGIQAQDLPGDGRRWRLRLGAADSGTVLAATRPCDLIYRLVAAFGGISHGLHLKDRKVYKKKSR